MTSNSMRIIFVCVLIGATASAQFQGVYSSQKVPQIDPRLQPVPTRVRVAEAAAKRYIVHRVAPVYPDKALAACVQGSVAVWVEIAKDGSVTRVTLDQGPDLLARAAIDAVRQWRYRPYLLNGRAVEMVTRATLRFKLPQGQCVKT